MTEAAIVIWAHRLFGKPEDPNAKDLVGRVTRVATEDAGIAPRDVGAIFAGHFTNGFQRQDFPAYLVLDSVTEPRFRLAARQDKRTHGMRRDGARAGRGRG
jgi:acetyl-CoA C-acetyltransferase